MEWFAGIGALRLPGVAAMAVTFLGAYLIGSIPWAYVLVGWLTGEDITEHGTGNVGAMNVKRTTGSWGWFAVAMVADALKGIGSVLLARWLAAPLLSAMSGALGGPAQAVGATVQVEDFVAQAALIGAVVGHNWSLYLSVAKGRLMGGKGLATGGGALLAYDPLYFAIVIVGGLSVIFITKYMMAGQVAAAVVLPLFTIATQRPDWPFTLVLGIIVYVRHHRRFMGLLRGEEPRFYTKDNMGPKG
ncbi:MAG TPA: glycerol-3-phosphate acyltransferase [Coriobacteriia bacterium]